MFSATINAQDPDPAVTEPTDPEAGGGETTSGDETSGGDDTTATGATNTSKSTL